MILSSVSETLASVSRHPALESAIDSLRQGTARERLAGLHLDLDDYISHYQLDAERLAAHAPKAIVMHPGPMIRGLEIDSAVADGPQSGVLDQVTNGLAVRMALLYHLIGRAPADAPHPAKDRSNASD